MCSDVHGYLSLLLILFNTKQFRDNFKSCSSNLMFILKENVIHTQTTTNRSINPNKATKT